MNEKKTPTNIAYGVICPDCNNPVNTTDNSLYECSKCREIESSLSSFKPKEKPLKVAFGAFRAQPVTNGHYRVWAEMLRDNDVVILGLGSINLEAVANNPFSAKQRTEMIRMLFGKGSKDKIKIVPLNDIGATEREEWVEYCMKQIKGKQLPTPTKYYAGSPTDLDWFKDSVNADGNKIELIDMNRHETNILSGSLVRQSISTGTDEWKEHVPQCIVEYIDENYPKELTLKYQREKRKKREGK